MMLAWLKRTFLYTATPNPSVIGQLKLTADEIDAEALARYEKKLSTAKDYLSGKELTVQSTIHNARTGKSWSHL